jgi:hypothetical protein
MTSWQIRHARRGLRPKSLVYRPRYRFATILVHAGLFCPRHFGARRDQRTLKTMNKLRIPASPSAGTPLANLLAEARR